MSCLLLLGGVGCAVPVAPAPQNDSEPAHQKPEAADAGSESTSTSPAMGSPKPPPAWVPKCDGRECGDDGCQGRCGMCDEGKACEERMGHCIGICIPSCDRRVCGEDGCGGSCGSCPQKETCTKEGVCLAATCGNGRVEPGEECDGDPECSPSCKRLSESQLKCIMLQQVVTGDAKEMARQQACFRCSCLECPDPTAGCYLSGDTTRDAACGKIADCAVSSMCANFDCFCGDASCQSAGPCLDAVQSALGKQNALQLTQCAANTDCVLNRCNKVGECIRNRCGDVCTVRSATTTNP